MKKALLTGATILAFVLYALLQKGSHAGSQLTSSTGGTNTTQGGSGAPAGYRNGSYTGSPADALYGTLQVKAVIKGGRLADVQFLSLPQDSRVSDEINGQATPILRQRRSRRKPPASRWSPGLRSRAGR